MLPAAGGDLHTHKCPYADGASGPTVHGMDAKLEDPPPLEPDRGIAFLLFFMVAAILVVGAVTLVGSIDEWWMLIAAVLVYLGLSVAVLAGVVHLLDDERGA